MLTVPFGEPAMSRTQVQLWYNRFKEGREDVNDDPDLLRKIMTGYDIENIAQSSQWKRPEEPRPKKTTSNSVK